MVENFGLASDNRLELIVPEFLMRGQCMVRNGLRIKDQENDVLIVVFETFSTKKHKGQEMILASLENWEYADGLIQKIGKNLKALW